MAKGSLMLKVASLPAGERFRQVLNQYPRASLLFDVERETSDQCVIKASLFRWPDDPAPAVAHAGSVMQGDVRWNRAFEDARQAACDRACQNLWVPGILLEGPSPSERRKTQHAAFAWLVNKAREDTEWHVERREIYEYLAQSVGFSGDNAEAQAKRFAERMSAERPDRDKLVKLLEFFAREADERNLPLDLPGLLWRKEPSADAGLAAVEDATGPRPALLEKARFFHRYPDATFATRVITADKYKVVMHASAYLGARDGFRRFAAGLGIGFRGQGPTAVNFAGIETVETYAVRNALDIAGFGESVSDGPARVELASAREVTALVAMAKTDGAVVREHADRVGLTPAQASRLREHLEGGESLAEGIESVLRAPANDERMLVMA